MSIHLVMYKQIIHLYDGTLPSNEKNILLIHGAAWMNLKSIMLS